MSTMPVTDDKRTAIRSMHLMASGDLTDFEAVYTGDAVNREAKDEPPDTRIIPPFACRIEALPVVCCVPPPHVHPTNVPAGCGPAGQRR